MVLYDFNILKICLSMMHNKLTVMNHFQSEPVANSSSDYKEINVTVAVMASDDFDSLKVC